MDLAQARALAERALPDVLPAHEATAGRWTSTALTPEEFPLPELILVGLRDLRDLPSFGPMEKMRWAVSGRVGDIPFSVALHKFGPSLRLPVTAGADELRLVVARLHRAAKIAERYLQSLAASQLRSANATVINEYIQFDRSYRFFRERAATAYDTPPPPVQVIATNASGEPTGWASEPFKPQVEGGYLAGAMLDAYFSRLEHLLVLLLPFTCVDLSTGAALDFMAAPWDDKWKRLFSLSSEPAMKKAFDVLKQLKESIRNPLAHGGFSKKGTSLFFHVDRVGALPVLLSKHGRSWEFTITRIPSRSFDELCAQLDEVDEALAQSRLWAGVTFAQSGLNVALDPESCARCREAADSAEALEAFMDRLGHLQDLHANMDY